MRTLVVVQARLGSTRLPGKTLLPLAGAPLLQRVVERIRAARSRFDLVVATTLLPADDRIASLCRIIDVACFRGHRSDLLDRHFQAARAARADVVVKIPSDCPLLDPEALDLVLARLLANPGRFDYVSNLHPESWPDGSDVEAFRFEALEQAWREATQPHEREHTTPFLWDQPERFRLGNVTRPDGRDLSLTYRLVVDYPEDYALAAAVYEALWREGGRVFGLGAVLELLAARPELAARNAHLRGLNWYRHHRHALRTLRREARLP